MISGNSFQVTKIIRFIGRPLLILFAFDMAVVLAYVQLGWMWVALPHIPLTIFGGVIGVIVGFRNNSSYARWWEARTLWGAVVNYSRTLTRQALTLVVPQNPADAGQVRTMQRDIVYHQIAYVYSLRNHLRGLDAATDLQDFLPEEEIAHLRQQRNVPLAIQGRIAALLAVCAEHDWIDAIRWSALDSSLTALANAQGGAERIKNTPMPKQYDFFPQLFVTVYCILLPLGIVANLRWLTPLGSALIGLIFLALDEVGRDLENPFDNTIHDVPLTSICRTIEISLKQELGEPSLPSPLKPLRGVLW